jgi:hypothetical protein
MTLNEYIYTYGLHPLYLVGKHAVGQCVEALAWVQVCARPPPPCVCVCVVVCSVCICGSVGSVYVVCDDNVNQELFTSPYWQLLWITNKH